MRHTMVPSAPAELLDEQRIKRKKGRGGGAEEELKATHFWQISRSIKNFPRLTVLLQFSTLFMQQGNKTYKIQA